jgi:DNA-binding XRE family transcriptional regulator
MGPVVIPRREGAVYLIESAGGLTKIGRSRYPESRVTHVARERGQPCCLIHAIESDDCWWLESALHRLHAPRRFQGEWFALLDRHVEELQAVYCWDRPRSSRIRWAEGETIPLQRDPADRIVRRLAWARPFGKYLRAFRREFGLDRVQLAAHVGLHWQDVRRLEEGVILPTWPLILKFARLFGCEPSFLTDYRLKDGDPDA